MVRGAITNNSIRLCGVYLLCTGAFFAFYAFLHITLDRQGILHPDLMLFGEKALLVWKGFPPRFENFGFIHPPLPILIVGLAQGHLFVAQAGVAAVISAVLVVHVWKTAPSLQHVFPMILYVVFGFPILFLATQRFDLYLYFFMVVLSARFLYRYKEGGRLLDLFLAGPLLGASFLVHFSALYLAPMFLILIGLLYRDQPKMIAPIALTFFTPFGVALLAFAYINLIFTGEAFGFLRQNHSLGSNAIEVAAVSGNVIQGIVYTLKQVVLFLPIIVPCWAGLRHLRTPLALLPFMVLLSSVYAGASPAVAWLAIFMVYFLMMTDGRESIKPAISFSLLGISLLASPVAAFYSAEPHEKRVIHALLETGQAGQNMEPLQKVVEQLKGTKGKILLDDVNGYPVVYLMNTSERFILPYQYEFAVALSDPVKFADHAIAWKNRPSDLVLEAFKNPTPYFRKRFENEAVIIWERRT